MNIQTDTLAELAKEATIGGMGTTVDREIPVIDLSDFDNRKHEIADALWRPRSISVSFRSIITASPRTTSTRHSTPHGRSSSCQLR